MSRSDETNTHQANNKNPPISPEVQLSSSVAISYSMSVEVIARTIGGQFIIRLTLHIVNRCEQTVDVLTHLVTGSGARVTRRYQFKNVCC